MKNPGLIFAMGMGKALGAGLEGMPQNTMGDLPDVPTTPTSLGSTGYSYNSPAQVQSRFNFMQSY